MDGSTVLVIAKAYNFAKTYIENIFQCFLSLSLLQAHLSKAEVGTCEAMAQTCIVPARARNVDQTESEEQNEQRQTPSVASCHCQHLHLISAPTPRTTTMTLTTTLSVIALLRLKL